MIYLALMIVPVLIALGTMVFEGTSLKSFGAQMAVQAILIGCLAYVIGQRNNADTEVWNGKITSKYSEHVSCSHSYSCNCRMHYYSCGKSTCSQEVCDTCYEHSYDVDWVAKDSTGWQTEISRVDRRGLREPSRWTAVSIGEPSSHTHGYVNYIKGNPDSLFRKTGLVETYKDSLPAYPSEVYDYYRINRLITVGLSLPDAAEWNKELSVINGDLGSSKQVNAIVVVVRGKPREWFEALEQNWLGGKKNDAVTVIGVDQVNKISWVEEMSLSNELFKIKMRDSIVGLDVLDRSKVLEQVRLNVQNHFIRRSMKDFEYLNSTSQPSITEWVLALILSIAVSVGLSFYFYQNDL